jgi:hypothetical protein
MPSGIQVQVPVKVPDPGPITTFDDVTIDDVDIYEHTAIETAFIKGTNICPVIAVAVPWVVII